MRSYICSIEGCGRSIYGLKEWCKKHYQIWSRHGDVNYKTKTYQPPGWCIVPECQNRRQSSSGYCAMHYRRLVVHGDVNITLRRDIPDYEIINEDTAQIILTQGYKAILDLEDAERINEYLWIPNIQRNTYVRAYRQEIIQGNKRAIYMQHEILGIMPWELNGQEVDHEDRNPLNNKKDNLRIVTHQINMQNTPSFMNGKGVTFNKRANLWLVYLDLPNEKRKYLGYKKTEELALSHLNDVKTSLGII